jgi:hypothetical protein
VFVGALVALAALAAPGAAVGVAPTHPADFARLRGGNQQPAFGRSGDKGGRKGAFKIAVRTGTPPLPLAPAPAPPPAQLAVHSVPACGGRLAFGQRTA